MAEFPRCPNCGNNVVESWLWCRHCGFDPYAPAGAPNTSGGPGPAGAGSGSAAPGPGGYGAPGYAPGYGAPGFAPGYGAPGYAPGGYVPAPPRRSGGAVVAIIVAVVILIPVFLIAAVTLLGRNASVKFSAVGSVIDPGYVYPSTSYVPTTAPPSVTTGPPTTTGRKILPDWTDVTGAGGWKIAFPNQYVEDTAPVGPFGGANVIEAKSVKIRDGVAADRLEIFVLDTAGVSKTEFVSQVQTDMKAKLGYPALASKNLMLDGREAIWFEPKLEGNAQLLHKFTAVIAIDAGEVSYVLVSANGSGTAGQDDLLQRFATSFDAI